MRILQKIILAIAVAFGLVAAASMMYVAWEHNPQGEFHETDGSGTIHWLSWLPIGGGWFAVGFGIVWLPCSAVELAAHLVRSRISRGRTDNH